MYKSIRILIARNRPSLEILKQSTLICWPRNQLPFTPLPTGITFHLVVGISMKCSRSVHIVDCTKDSCTGHIPYHHNLPPSLFRQMTRTETLIFCIALRDDIRFTRGCHKDRKMSHYPIPGSYLMYGDIYRTAFS